MKFYIIILVFLLEKNISSAQLKDGFLKKYDLDSLVPDIEYFDNDHLKISYINYFKVFPKY